MIKFFRHIRKSLLMENPSTEQAGKTSKYFKYAIGEIILVVIGILIALQINNWNENRKDRASEIKYLNRIKSELIQDSVSISIAIQTNLKRKKRAEYLLQFSKNNFQSIDEPTYFIESIEYAGYTHSPQQIDHTYEEIKSAGRLALLINEDLKTQISSYYAYVENRNQYRFIIEQIQLKYIDYHMGILSDDQQIQLGNFQNKVDYTHRDALLVLRRMRSNEKFIQLLPYVVQSKVRTHDILNKRFERIKNLIASIENELKNRD